MQTEMAAPIPGLEPGTTMSNCAITGREMRDNTLYIGSIPTYPPSELFAVRHAENGLILRSGSNEWVFRNIRDLGKWITKEFNGKNKNQQ